MICRVSSTGIRIDSKRRDRPAHTPSGIPISSESATEMATRTSVCMLSSQSPSTPNARNPSAVSSAMRQPANTRATALAIPVMPVQPSCWVTHTPPS